MNITTVTCFIIAFIVDMVIMDLIVEVIPEFDVIANNRKIDSDYDSSNSDLGLLFLSYRIKVSIGK